MLVQKYELGLDHWFWISNGKSKYWNFWPSLAYNIALENIIVKLRLTCIEVCFQPLRINIKPMFWPCWLLIWRLFLFFLWDILSLFLHNHEFYQNNLIEKRLSGLLLLVFFFNLFGIFYTLFGFLHIWKNSSVNFLTFLKYFLSIAS